VVALALAVLTAVVVAVADADPDHDDARVALASVAAAPAAPCGTEAATVAARSAGLVARRIYELELNSAEVRADRRQVETNQPLLTAVASGNRAAIQSAVTALVFSGTHIVRLRVTAGAGVLADVGGPYIIAPVGGSLRTGGRTVGRYVLSVQDDLGYVKLEQRFIGAPLLLRTGGGRIPVEGTLPDAAASLPRDGTVSYHGQVLQAVSFTARAFPASALNVTLLLDVAASSPRPCIEVADGELARIGERVWRRFVTVGAPVSSYPHQLGSLTGALAYVRSGSRQLAGSSSPGPSLRDSGIVRYRGASYRIYSFPSVLGGHRVRIYQLLPAA
jgi:hypothetical protein